jgi:hypothetical protein
MAMSSTERGTAMLKKALVAAALTAASGVALANPPHWAPAHGYRAHVRHYAPPVRYYYPPAPRVVYRPAPVYVAPAPVYVRPAPIVVPAPAIVFRLHFPL